jgi:c(7)-type cytochrome triheme protein
MSHRLGWTALAAWGILAGGLLLTACTSSHQLLTVFFDGVPPPGEASPPRPVVKPPRRLPYKPPEAQVKIVEDVDLPPPIDWRARYEALAKNAAGDVDWARALSEKSITPKAGIAADAKDEEPTDMDLEYVPKGKPEYKVVFPHRPHTQWLGCPNCHTGIFEMEKGKAAMTMEKINEGAYCGVCHGKVASPDITNCPACHKAM